MPSVSNILTMVKNLSLVGSGDSTDDARLMQYMNLMYGEIYRSTAETYPTVLLTSETVVITAGAGTLAEAPMTVKRVKDMTTNRILKRTNLLELEDRYPALDAVTEPDWYYLTSTTALNTYPMADATVLVRHIPLPATLTTATTEADIKIPPQFHDMLVWGTLIYACMDERDKVVGTELNLAQSKYEIALAAYQQWLALSQTGEPQETKAYLGG